jgi:hypothetical protein
MIYIYRRPGSTGAVALARAIGGIRTKGFTNRVSADDVVVCWGERDPGVGGKVLNGAPLRTKVWDAERLAQKGVDTITVSRTRPTSGDWLGRTAYHQVGNDLMTPTTHPDFWSKREDIVEEYRVHSFLGKSLRAGIKKMSRTATIHPWIRSYDGGWRICYEGFSSTPAMRKLAKDACEALNLDFAAIDIAKRRDGSLFVLEANRAPGIEGSTIPVYVKAINEWSAAR